MRDSPPSFLFEVNKSEAPNVPSCVERNTVVYFSVFSECCVERRDCTKSSLKQMRWEERVAVVDGDGSLFVISFKRIDFHLVPSLLSSSPHTNLFKTLMLGLPPNKTRKLQQPAHSTPKRSIYCFTPFSLCFYCCSLFLYTPPLTPSCTFLSFLFSLPPSLQKRYTSTY